MVKLVSKLKLYLRKTDVFVDFSCGENTFGAKLMSGERRDHAPALLRGISPENAGNPGKRRGPEFFPRKTPGDAPRNFSGTCRKSPKRSNTGAQDSISIMCWREAFRRSKPRSTRMGSWMLS